MKNEELGWYFFLNTIFVVFSVHPHSNNIDKSWFSSYSIAFPSLFHLFEFHFHFEQAFGFLLLLAFTFGALYRKQSCLYFYSSYGSNSMRVFNIQWSLNVSIRLMLRVLSIFFLDIFQYLTENNSIFISISLLSIRMQLMLEMWNWSFFLLFFLFCCQIWRSPEMSAGKTVKMLKPSLWKFISPLGFMYATID